MFDCIPIPMCDVLESDPVAMAGCLQPGSTIDEKDRAADPIYLIKF
jgi:hypothetical protein